MRQYTDQNAQYLHLTLGRRGATSKLFVWTRSMPRSRRCRHRGNGNRSGKGCPPPQPIEGFGERHKLPLRGPCGAPRKRSLVHFMCCIILTY